MFEYDIDLTWLYKKEMFWEWLYDLQRVSWGNIRGCPNCSFRIASDCGYGYRDYWGEFDCLAPEDLDCDDCKYLYCSVCKEEK